MIGYDDDQTTARGLLASSRQRLTGDKRKLAGVSAVLLVIPFLFFLSGPPPVFSGLVGASAKSKASWHGVSLGGWLVMEINPSQRTPTSPMDLRPQWMYDQIEANSEIDFVATLRREHGDEYAVTTMRNHWEGYITEENLDEAKALGISAVRIPVGFWIMDAPVGGSSPLEYGISPDGFVTGGLNHLHAMLVQLKKRGIGALVDVHAHPCNSACVSDGMYCATPLAFGRIVEGTTDQVEDVAVGDMQRCAHADAAGGPVYPSKRTPAPGAVTWKDVAVNSVSALAEWIAALPEEADAVVALQLANEPSLGPDNPAVTAGINAFYDRAMAAARAHLPTLPLVLSWINPSPMVFPFLKAAGEADAKIGGGGVISDHHYYLNWQGWMLPPGELMSWAEILRRACTLEAETGHVLDLYTAANQEVIIGEWSLATNMDAPIDLSNADVRMQLRRFYRAQLEAMSKVAVVRGAFFWTLRMGSGWDPRPSPGHPKGKQLDGTSAGQSLKGYRFQVWSLLEMAQMGIVTALDKSYEGTCASL